MFSYNLIKKQAVSIACFMLFVFVSFDAVAQNDLYNRLSRAERDIETLSRSVYKGEKLPDSMVGGIEDDQKYRAQMDVRMNDLETQIRELRGQVEQFQFSIDNLTSRMQMLETQSLQSPQQGVQQQAQPTIQYQDPQPTISQPAASEAGGQPSSQSSFDGDVSQSSQNLSAPSQPTEAYEAAFSLLKSGDNAGAEVAFEKFIADHPNDDLANNARYWLGETYYVQNQYDKAARVFAEAYQKAPKGAKAPDNLLKLGLSLSGLGRTDDACVSFGQLDKEFGATSSAIVRRGEQERSKLGC